MKSFIVQREKQEVSRSADSVCWYEMFGTMWEPNSFARTTGLKLKPGEKARVRLVRVKN